MNLQEWTRGKWPEIIRSLIGPQYTDNRHQPCPKGDGTDRFRFSDKHGTGNYFCACSDGRSDGFELIKCVKGCSMSDAIRQVEGVIGKREQEEREPRKQTWAEKLQGEVIESSRSNYLESRGLEVAPGLRWHKSLPYFKDGAKVGEYPAMMAPVTRNGKFITYHATYLFPNGEKDRKILPANGSIRGAAIELYPLTRSKNTLCVAEGVETAIAVRMLLREMAGDVPVWSLLNTSGMKSWTPPQGVENVYIFGDNDKSFAGHAAAYQLAHSLKGKGKYVSVHFPDQAGTDFNDVLNNGGFVGSQYVSACHIAARKERS